MQRPHLPTTHRAGPFFDAGATAMPCWSIGGDFFDYMDLPGDALGFALGDVAGKGPPAALLAALIQGSLAAHASDGPAATMAAVNAAIVRRGIQGRFVTLFYGVLSPTAGSGTATQVTTPQSLRAATAFAGWRPAGRCWVSSRACRTRRVP